ncbi:CRISPR-associated protein, Cas1 family [Frankia casuarinae]|uniref:CRISPR-associated endonuclease Cas1 n=1 Tax=Frankia casuarinae (strain DSM 45818 / CECT 9043 / HFP020203 / CcI3) TaxID=106370 RepID=Q2J7N9_FRACC|nr:MULTISPECIES: type I-C CRISPR-associated endonuclease Cas1c [Frankia]ABD12703.1 CRISPR-associated protein, Cas1 family [Frankia casuarinae]EYT91148.1 CRISPR-associated protein, Cas1 family [Frankia casuarinae]KDA41605.1 CRISPR-associated protein, Cas1 family [Frankia sp. BMG5.23]TFE24181.1 type I-C CRISPR-associated endonuclease Cas1 [Frankia sp. B2]
MAELLNTLYATTPGTSLHLDGDAVRIWHPDNDKGRRLLPLVRVDHIVVFGGVTITDDLLQRCATDRRSVTWLTGNGRFRARVEGPTGGNPHLRIAQHDHFRDDERRLTLAMSYIAGKLQNSRQLLLRAARDATGTRQTALRDTAAHLADALPTLRDTTNVAEAMGVEGQAARRYIATWPHLLTPHATVTAPAGRTSRPATDPVNAALSFGYGILRIAVHGALDHVGLDPHIGYLHGIRPGKPALALDLMEEFRALLVDRLVFTAFNQRQLTDADFEHHPGGSCQLTESGRKNYLTLWSQARARTWPHTLLTHDTPAATLPLLQARILARHLRGDIPRYIPWSPT